jgi:hypothetical protein
MTMQCERLKSPPLPSLVALRLQVCLVVSVSSLLADLETILTDICFSSIPCLRLGIRMNVPEEIDAGGGGHCFRGPAG